MNKLLIVALVFAGAAGCSKKRVAECDAFVETIEKISKCDKLPADQRTAVSESGKQIKDALKMIDDAGGVGDAPEDLVKQLRDTCKTQNTTVIEQFQKVAPDCVK
jgi:hypothetical protein